MFIIYLQILHRLKNPVSSTGRKARMPRIWGIIRVKEKIAADAVVELPEADLDAVMDGLCKALDIPRPVVLKKHRSEFLRFFRTRFAADDFVEPVRFDCLEAEILRDRKKKDAAHAAPSSYD
jgi:hypothetical protein